MVAVIAGGGKSYAIRKIDLSNIVYNIYNFEINCLERAVAGDDIKYFNDCINNAEASAKDLWNIGAVEKAKELEERCEYLRSKPFSEIRMEYYLEKDEVEHKEEDVNTLVEEVNNYFRDINFC